MTKQRALILAGASVLVLVVLMVVLNDRGPIPLVSVRQGVSVQEASFGKVFVLREGSQVYAVATTTKQGYPITWCGYEEMYWSPKTNALWDRYGNPLRQGTSPNDGIRLRATTVDESLGLTIQKRAPASAPPRAKVSKAVLKFFDQWLNRDNLPTTKKLEWCPNPLT